MPTTPTLTIADNQDGTGAVATVAGGDAGSTNVIWTAAITQDYSTLTWTNSGNRTGNGTVSLSLTSGVGYWAYCAATLSGSTALSNLVFFQVSNSSQATHERLLQATVSRIQSLGLSGISNANIFARKVPIARDVGSGQTYAYPAIICSPVVGAERMNVEEGTSGQDDITYPILVAVLAADNQSVDGSRATYLEWRRRIAKAFRNQRLSAVTENWRIAVEPGPILDPVHWKNNRAVSLLTLRCTCRETRGAAA